MPAATSRLPVGPISVPGPGPAEPNKDSPVVPYASKPTPATPSASSIVDDDDDDDDDNGRAEVYDEDEDEDRAGAKTSSILDPYANLDSAFVSNQDSHSGQSSSKRNDDLLI